MCASSRWYGRWPIVGWIPMALILGLHCAAASAGSATQTEPAQPPSFMPRAASQPSAPAADRPRLFSRLRSQPGQRPTDSPEAAAAHQPSTHGQPPTGSSPPDRPRLGSRLRAWLTAREKANPTQAEQQRRSGGENPPPDNRVGTGRPKTLRTPAKPAPPAVAGDRRELAPSAELRSRLWDGGRIEPNDGPKILPPIDAAPLAKPQSEPSSPAAASESDRRQRISGMQQRILEDLKVRSPRN
jgi:hypothetical protein